MGNDFPVPSNAQAQLDPESTGITADFFEKDARWINARIAPVFGVKRRRARLRRWAAEDALPRGSARTLRASGGQGAEIMTDRPTPIEFYIDGGMLTSRVTDQELIDAAEDGVPEEPWQTRAIKAAAYLQLESETRISPYFIPGAAHFPGANIVAGSLGTWKGAPEAELRLSTDVKAIRNAFQLRYGVFPNGAIIDSSTDEWFLDQLAKERKVQVILGGGDTPDLLGSADGQIVAGMEIVVPNARKQDSAYSAYSPVRVWGEIPYFIPFFSPTLAGQEWNKAGDCYVAQAELRVPGISPFAVYRQRIADESEHATKMWWEFDRTAQVVKPDMVMAVGPIR